MEKDEYCRKCGSKIEAGNQFCGKCGEKVFHNEVQVNDGGSHVFQGIISIGFIAAGIICLFIGALWTGGALLVAGIALSPGAFYSVKNSEPIVLLILVCCVVAFFSFKSFRKEMAYIDLVKEGHLKAFQSQTVGEAFDYYFQNPKWDYFESEYGLDIVEFQGKYTYNGKSKKIKIQFVVNDDEFVAEHFSVDGKRSTYEELYELLVKVFK